MLVNKVCVLWPGFKVDADGGSFCGENARISINNGDYLYIIINQLIQLWYTAANTMYNLLQV